jgi:hypothetical protein
MPFMDTPIRAIALPILSGLALCLLSISVVDAGPTSGSKVQILTNPNFEPPYTPVAPSTGKSQISGILANGWRDNSAWANVTVQYGQVTSAVPGCHFAQSIRVDAVREGGVQFVQPFKILNNHAYAASIWVLGKPGAKVSAAIRQNGPPYTQYGYQAITLNGKWQELLLQASAPASTDGMFIIYPPTGSRLIVDKASLVDNGAYLRQTADTQP